MSARRDLQVPFFTDRDRVTMLRARLQKDLALWQRVPWCVFLGSVVQDAVRFPPPFLRPDPTRVRPADYRCPSLRELSVQGLLIDTPAVWLLDPADIELGAPLVTAVECTSGTLVGFPTFEPCRPLTDAEVIEWVLPRATFCNPQPLLDQHDRWAREADMGSCGPLLCELGVTPTMLPDDHAPVAFNQAVLALAATWDGNAASMLDAAHLLLEV